MKVYAPIEYKHVFEKMPSDLFHVEERNGEVVFTCSFPLSISRFTAKLSPREFAAFARKLRGEGFPQRALNELIEREGLSRDEILCIST